MFSSKMVTGSVPMDSYATEAAVIWKGVRSEGI
jgi:hypothetical protein